ncbi:MAG: ABC transporter ATP-binding protein [Chloroflexota bacterium]|nr:ABC transporter ATP-binding protein [Chloroflexota bacterium]
MIEVKDLTKRYSTRLAVDHISFKAPEGEVVGLLGPNGAGKTTTMRMLTGFMPPTSGSASIAGIDILEDSLAARAKVGYLPERVPVYPDMTVEEYVLFWAKLRGAKAPRKQTATVLERVSLADRSKTLVRNLSKGMRQRLGLAQALVHNPPVIILDEPTIGIDPQQVIEVRDTVRSLARGHTVLFSTHILSEAEQVCDRVVIINHGKIVAQGKPAELRKKLQPDLHLYIQIDKLTPKEIEKLLKSIPQVENVQKAGDGYNVRVKKNADIRTELIDRVLRAGGSIQEMRSVIATLENVFLDIVGKEDV